MYIDTTKIKAQVLVIILRSKIVFRDFFKGICVYRLWCWVYFFLHHKAWVTAILLYKTEFYIVKTTNVMNKSYCAFHQVRGLNFFKLQRQFEISNNKTYHVKKLVFSRSWRYPSADNWFKIKPTIGRIVFLHCKFPSDFVYPEGSISGSR